MKLDADDTIWIEPKVSQSSKSLDIKISLILLKLPSVGHYSSCSLKEPAKTTLVEIGDCTTDSENLVEDGYFKAPMTGVYKTIYNGNSLEQLFEFYISILRRYEGGRTGKSSCKYTEEGCIRST